MISIVDYRVGNLSSVLRAFEALDEEAVITSDPEAIRRSELIVLPGMGAFGNGMRNLLELGLADLIRILVIAEKRPLLGICLGMQLLGDRSYEFGEHKGLGIISGEVQRLEAGQHRLPHMGWNEVMARDPMFEGIRLSDSSFYFAHSYHLIPSDSSAIAATTIYGNEFVSAVRKDNVFAVQFHPEKSQANGLILLGNIIRCSRKG
jgi:imidazole glycerol-phosphate synthase subunit HisH